MNDIFVPPYYRTSRVSLPLRNLPRSAKNVGRNYAEKNNQLWCGKDSRIWVGADSEAYKKHLLSLGTERLQTGATRHVFARMGGTVA